VDVNRGLEIPMGFLIRVGAVEFFLFGLKLKMKQFLLSFSFLIAGGYFSLHAQELIIQGTVTAEADGAPLPGVSVQVKGTANSAITGADGVYQITVTQNFFTPTPEPVLVFSIPGLKTEEVAVRGRNRIDISLRGEGVPPAEAFYTGCAAGRAKDNMSFSGAAINEELLNIVPSAIAGAGFQGKSAGLRVFQPGGQPGQGVFFQLRAANAIANGQQPLIIIDGIYLNGANLTDINTEDIERVEILKGPAGAAYYGAQAANGVIQIFTKRGKGLETGKTQVTYRGEFGFSQEAGRYDINEFTNRSVVDPNGPQPVLGNLTASRVHDVPLPNLQDYQDDVLFRRGAFHTNYLSVQSKSPTTNFLTSFHRLQDEGVVQSNSGYTRNSFRLNLDHRIGGKFGAWISSMYSTSEQDLVAPNASGPGNQIASALLLAPMFDLDVPNEEDGAPFDWDIDNTGFGITNPLYDRANSSQIVNRTRFLGNFGVNYYPAAWLTLGYSGSLDRASNAFEHFLEKGYLSSNVPGLFGPEATAGFQGSNGGGIQRTNRYGNYFTSQFEATIRKNFLGFHTALRGGFLYENLKQEFNESRGESLAVEQVRSLDNAQRNIRISSESQEVVAKSGFGAFDADYKDKYLFSGVFRLEEASPFGLERRYVDHYRVSGAYRVTEDVKIRPFQELKLRASLGTAGIRPTFEQRFETFKLINGTITKNTLGNDFLRPALSTEMEVGVHAAFLRGFDLEFNYVTVKTEDQILLAPLTGAAGFSGQWRNAGTVEATVYEAELNTDFTRLFKINARDFRWNLLVTFDKIQQTVTQLSIPAYQTGPGIPPSSLFLIEEGRSLGAMAGEVFATSIEQLQDQEGVNPSDFAVNPAGYVVRENLLGTPDERPYKLVDENGNPVIQQIGDINPDFRMGFAHIIEYKGLQLYTLFDWKKGGDVYNASRQWLYGSERHADLSAYPDVAAGFFGAGGLYNNRVANNHFVEDGSFFMLREAALSLTLRNNILGGLIDGLRFSLIGRNLFTKTNYTGFHPDVTSAPRDENLLTNRILNGRGSDDRTPNGDPALFAVDSFNYPLRRSVTFSLQAVF
jgi:TonB-linked SusC/RagA family outer membrane protein